jgi:hypothetical protein
VGVEECTLHTSANIATFARKNVATRVKEELQRKSDANYNLSHAPLVHASNATPSSNQDMVIKYFATTALLVAFTIVRSAIIMDINPKKSDQKGTQKIMLDIC